MSKNMNTFPTKLQWKTIVKNVIWRTENNQLKSRINSDSDFERFRATHSSYRPHPLLKAALQSNIKASDLFLVLKVLTCIPKTSEQTCTICNLPYNDTILHAATQCGATFTIRYTFTDFVINEIGTEEYIFIDSLSDEEVLQTFLGKTIPSHLSSSHQLKFKMTKLLVNSIRLFYAS